MRAVSAKLVVARFGVAKVSVVRSGVGNLVAWRLLAVDYFDLGSFFCGVDCCEGGCNCFACSGLS